MGKVSKGIGIGIAILFGSIILLYTVSPIVNNLSARAVAQQLKAIPLPEDTEYVEKIYCAGKLVGNGNGMQYLGCILIKSELTKEELEHYYAQYAQEEWECLVEQQVGQEIEFALHERLSYQTEIDDETYYTVYSWGSGIAFFSEWDLRGH